MKSKYITIISIFIAIVFAVMFGFSKYSNNEMRRQLHEREIYIEYIDSIVGIYYNKNIEFTDSSMVFKFPVDQYGNTLKFHDLDSIRYMNERIILTQDAVIRHLKQRYKCNYSVKVKGDSILISSWNK